MSRFEMYCGSVLISEKFELQLVDIRMSRASHSQKGY